MSCRNGNCRRCSRTMLTQRACPQWQLTSSSWQQEAKTKPYSSTIWRPGRSTGPCYTTTGQSRVWSSARRLTYWVAGKTAFSACGAQRHGSAWNPSTRTCKCDVKCEDDFVCYSTFSWNGVCFIGVMWLLCHCILRENLRCLSERTRSSGKVTSELLNRSWIPPLFHTMCYIYIYF